MKILFINDRGYEYGGGESYIHSLKQKLIEKGHDVKLLTSSTGVNQASNFSDYTYRGTNNILVWIIKLYNPFSLFKLHEVLKKFKPDVVHIHGVCDETSYSILDCLNKYPTLMTIHDPDLVCPSGGVCNNKICNHFFGVKCIKCIGVKGFAYEVVKRSIRKRLIKKINIIITPNQELLYKLKLMGFANVIKVSHGINLLKFTKIHNFKSILYIGRVVKIKGIEYLIRSIPNVLRKIPGVKLTIVGDGMDKNYFKNIVSDLKLDYNIKFIGKVNSNNVNTMYSNNSVIIVPSIWPEIFGLVGIEALSAGRPVIGSNVGGIPEWLEDGKSGFLVEPGNADQISKKIIKLFSDRKLLEKMSINARKKAKQFSINEHINKIIYQYNLLLKQHT